MSNYDHLQEVDYHPENLHPALLSLWRRGKAKLRYQPKGDLILFVHPLLPEGLPLAWSNDMYMPAIFEGGKVHPMKGTNSEKGKREYQVLLQGLNSLYETYRKGAN